MVFGGFDLIFIILLVLRPNGIRNWVKSEQIGKLNHLIVQTFIKVSPSFFFFFNAGLYHF